MNTMKLVALVLLVGGVLALIYGGFTYTKDTKDMSIGSMEISIEDKERVNVPIWAGVVLVAAGGGLLLFGGGRKR